MGWLVITVEDNEQVAVGEAVVAVMGRRGSSTRIGINAPAHISITRERAKVRKPAAVVAPDAAHAANEHE